MSQHVCPWWAGYLLASPIRKIRQNPEQILKDHISEGMNVLDYGCAMGFFSIPAAGIVGESGNVICIDIQEKMLSELNKRARKRGLDRIIQTHKAGSSTDPVSGFTDFFDCALAVHVIHEVPDENMVFQSIHKSLKPHGRLLFAEPSGHVSKKKFEQSLKSSQQYFTILEEKHLKNSYTAVLVKKEKSISV